MIYFTVNNEGTMIDSISYDYNSLRTKFKKEKIFSTEKLESIYYNQWEKLRKDLQQKH